MKRRALAWMWLAAACDPVGEPSDVATVLRGDLIVTVEVTGTMRAVDAERIGPPAVSGVWNYKIAMMAEEGSVVNEGEPVLAFDTSDLQRRLDEKTAERDSAATQLQLKQAAAKVARQDERLAIAEAEAELRKAKTKADAPPELTAIIDLQKARAEQELAEQKVEHLRHKSKWTAAQDAAEIARWKSKRDRAEGRVNEMRTAIEQMTVKAPRTGTVIVNADWQGEKKKVGDSAWRAETVLQVVSLDEMEAEGEIDEVDFSKVAIGQPVKLRLDAQADDELHGRVDKIAQTVQRASPENPLKVVRLHVALAGDGQVRVRPGMRFRGEIEVARHEDVVHAPLDAVVPTPDGAAAHRRTATGVEKVALTLGPRNAHFVVVTDGLSEGDELLRITEVEP